VACLPAALPPLRANLDSRDALMAGWARGVASKEHLLEVLGRVSGLGCRGMS
jgi:hypothetical protein